MLIAVSRAYFSVDRSIAANIESLLLPRMNILMVTARNLFIPASFVFIPDPRLNI